MIENRISDTIAPLKNVAMCGRALDRAITRPQHLPGMVCFYGPSGFGKSFAAAYTANNIRHYIECKSTWTKRPYCQQSPARWGWCRRIQCMI